MLESLEDTNILRFQEMPESKAELPFDVERDIPFDIKQQLIAECNEINPRENFRLYSEYAARLKLLWPEVLLDHNLDGIELNEPDPSIKVETTTIY